MLHASAVILAGGENSRLGRNKAFLQVGGRKIIERLISKLKVEFNEILIVCNRPTAYEYLGVKMVSDIIPGMGPLSGIHAGLTHAKHEYSLIVACDMPFIDKTLARMLVDEAYGYQAVVPGVGEYIQPLFAVYAKSCIPSIQQCLKDSITKVSDFYPHIRIKFLHLEELALGIDVEKAFMNVNTSDDLEHARRLAQNFLYLPCSHLLY